MPLPPPSAITDNPPAIVQSADGILAQTLIRIGQPGIVENQLPHSSFSPNLRMVQYQTEATETIEIKGISNRPIGASYTLVYVNGIRTSEKDAQQSSQLAKMLLDIDDAEVRLLFNPSENAASAGIKIFGAMTSRRLGEKAEPQSLRELKVITKMALEKPHNRLLIVGHSQGSLIIQNALDSIYDEYQKSSSKSKLWQTESKRIEVVLYAPLIRTIAPGPEAIALTNSCDLPARSLGGLSRLISDSKHYTGWRKQQAIKTIVYTPEENKLPDLIINPTSVHDSINLLFDNVDFNIRLLAENPNTKQLDAKTFAQNLHNSIALGKRADMLHYELIIKGCDSFGYPFARAFLNKTAPTKEGSGRCINNFMLKGARLARVRTTAEM